MTESLLLHSLAEFRELITACLDAAGARSVVEVGGEDGTFTRELAAWADERDGTVLCIDPAPGPDLAALARTSTTITLLRQRSLDSLSAVGPHDAYLIDGDHNYHTVSGELAAIEEAHGGHRRWLAILHDVGWPSGRRDMYYAPDTLPDGAVRPHSYDRGVAPDSSSVVEGGFRGAGEFSWAVEEGGPRNGVLTAVEDFLVTRPDLALARVPCLFGLGVLYPPGAPWGPAVAAVVEPYDQSPLLARMERNRLALYLKVLELGDDIGRTQRHADALALRIRDLDVENRALWARVGELERRVGDVAGLGHAVRDELDAVVRARSFKVAERLSRAHALVTKERGVSAERLRHLVDALDGAAAEEPGDGSPRARPQL